MKRAYPAIAGYATGTFGGPQQVIIVPIPTEDHAGSIRHKSTGPARPAKCAPPCPTSRLPDRARVSQRAPVPGASREVANGRFAILRRLWPTAPIEVDRQPRSLSPETSGSSNRLSQDKASIHITGGSTSERSTPLLRQSDSQRRRYGEKLPPLFGFQGPQLGMRRESGSMRWEVESNENFLGANDFQHVLAITQCHGYRTQTIGQSKHSSIKQSCSRFPRHRSRKPTKTKKAASISLTAFFFDEDDGGRTRNLRRDRPVL